MTTNPYPMYLSLLNTTPHPLGSPTDLGLGFIILCLGVWVFYKLHDDPDS